MKSSTLERETHHSKGWEGKASVDGCFYIFCRREEREREYIQEDNSRSEAWQSSRAVICGNTVNILSQEL